MKPNYASLYPTPASGSRKPPVTGGVNVYGTNMQARSDHTHYDPATCAEIEDLTSDTTFAVPKNAPGGRHLLLSPIGPPRITRIYTAESRAGRIDVEPAAPRSDGVMPELTVLSG